MQSLVKRWVFKRRIEEMAESLVVLKPVPKTRFDGDRLAPRLDSLAGKTIGLLDDGHTTAGDYLRGVGEILARQGAQVRYWRKPILSRPSPDTLLDEIAGAVDAVIVGAAA
jgi:hypothetical protein